MPRTAQPQIHGIDEEGRNILERMIEQRLNRTSRVYEGAVKALWIGNAGASVATLSFIGGTWRAGMFPKVLMLPLSCFVLGLVCMGIGSVVELWRTKGRLERMQKVDSFLDLTGADIESPVESAGLTLRDPRTFFSVASGALFVFGCLIGLAELWAVK